MAQPKRRAGETAIEYNRRLVTYYQNQKALKDAFYNDEDDVDIQSLTKGSQRQKKSYKLRNPRLYDEDRSRSEMPSGKKNIWKSQAEVEDVEDFMPRKKSSRPVQTPGDYTKNIGKRKTGKGEDPLSTRSKDSEYVYDDFEVDDSWRRDNNGSVRVSSKKVTPKNDEVRRENDDGWEIDTGSNRRPRRVVEGGKGIKKNGPVSSLSEDRILGGEDRIYGGGDRALGGDNSPRRTTGEKRASNNFDSSRVGYVTEDDAPRKRLTNWITTRDGKIAEANSTQNETKGEKRSARPETRSILEDGFRNNQKKEKRASGKVASFRGIKP